MEKFLDKNGKSILIIILSVILFEVFICNFSFFESLFYKELNVSDFVYNDGMKPNTDGSVYVLDSGERSFEILNINEKVKNVYLGIRRTDSYERKENDIIEYSLSASDDANELYFEMDRRYVVSEVEKSKYARVHLSGECKKLKVKLHYMENKNFIIEDIILNKKVPFYFSVYRVIALIAICAVIYILMPKNGFYNILFNKRNAGQNMAVIILISLHSLLIATFVYANPFFAVNSVSWHSQFNDMADAFIDGRFYISDEPSDTLKNMDNPYDSGYRGKLLEESGDRILWDHSYFEGKYYCYFGVIPIILFYVPYKLITQNELNNSAVVFILACFYVPACFLFMREAVKKWFKNIPFIIYVILSEALVLGSGFAFAIKRPDMYFIPILSGVVFSLWGLYFWLSALNERGIKGYRLFLGSLCMAFVAGCRPQMVLGSFLAIPLFYYYIKQKKLFSKSSIKESVLFVIPYFVTAAFLMYYNFKRFGSVFDFGANYNLTTNDMTKRGFVLARIPFGIFSYLFQPLVINGQFPFLNTVSLKTNYLGITIREAMCGGIFFSQPLVFASLLFFNIRAKLKEKNLFYFTMFSVLFGFIIVIADTEMAGVLSRYYMDFVWLFYIAAAFVIMCIYETVKDTLCLKLFYRCVSALFLFGIFCSFATLFLKFDYDVSTQNPEFFYNVMYTVQFWL